MRLGDGQAMPNGVRISHRCFRPASGGASPFNRPPGFAQASCLYVGRFLASYNPCNFTNRDSYSSGLMDVLYASLINSVAL